MRAGHRDRRLVGFDFDDALVLADRVAFGDQDVEHVAGLDSVAQFGQFDLQLLMSVRLSAESSFCWTQANIGLTFSGSTSSSRIAWLRDSAFDVARSCSRYSAATVTCTAHRPRNDAAEFSRVSLRPMPSVPERNSPPGIQGLSCSGTART